MDRSFVDYLHPWLRCNCQLSLCENVFYTVTCFLCTIVRFMLVVHTTLNCGTVSRFTVLILFALFVSKYYLNRGFYLPLLSITACLMPDMQCLLTSVRCPVVISLKLSKTDPLALWNTISKFAVLILLPHTYPPEPSPRLAPPLREISGFK